MRSKYTMKNVVFKPKNMTSEELLEGVRKMYKEFYSAPYTAQRVLKGLSIGTYPFLIILNRNAIARMNRRRLFSIRN